MNLIIDEEFKKLIPPLADEELKKLEDSIKSEGCRDALVTWNGIIIDGHNRYKICTENNIDFKTISRDFENREDVIEWMLKNQLGRRNLNDFQRNMIALRYEEVIRAQMKKKQIDGAKVGAQITNTACGPIGPQANKTRNRKELAKMAGTSEGSIQRSKLIIEKGSEEQKERAMKGEPISRIANEIQLENSGVETKKCIKCGKTLPITDFYIENGRIRNDCKKCKLKQKHDLGNRRDIKGNILRIDPSLNKYTEEEVIGDLYNTDRVVEYTIDDFVEEFESNTGNCLTGIKNMFVIHEDLLKDNDNKMKVEQLLNSLSSKILKMKGEL